MGSRINKKIIDFFLFIITYQQLAITFCSHVRLVTMAQTTMFSNDSSQVFFQKFLSSQLPQDIIHEVFVYSGVPLQHKQFFQNVVLPEVILRAIHKEIVYETTHFYHQLHDFEFVLQYDKYMQSIQFRRYGKIVFNLNVVTTLSFSPGWGKRLFWDDYSWDSLDDALQFVIRHFVWNIPLPDWYGEFLDELLWEY